MWENSKSHHDSVNDTQTRHSHPILCDYSTAVTSDCPLPMHWQTAVGLKGRCSGWKGRSRWLLWWQPLTPQPTFLSSHAVEVIVQVGHKVSPSINGSIHIKIQLEFACKIPCTHGVIWYGGSIRLYHAHYVLPSKISIVWSKTKLLQATGYGPVE